MPLDGAAFSPLGLTITGVAFSIELLEWGRIFWGGRGENILASRDFGYFINIGRFAVQI